jgi:hypothetical protein
MLQPVTNDSIGCPCDDKDYWMVHLANNSTMLSGQLVKEHKPASPSDTYFPPFNIDIRYLRGHGIILAVCQVGGGFISAFHLIGGEDFADPEMVWR